MASRAAQLAIELTERGAEDVASHLDDVTSSAKRMGGTVESAGKEARAGLDTTAEGADELASKGSQAAGALGGLGDLIGGPFGAAMQTGGIAMQAAADSGDLLNAALENSVVSGIRSKAATVANTVAQKAARVATIATTVAQKALNVAQRASPIGLIVTGVLLLVGALILAYKKSATFRAIVQGAMAGARAAVDKVVAGFQFLKDRAIDDLKALIAPIKLVADTLNVKEAIDKAADAFDFLKDKGVAAFKALVAPIQHIVDLIQTVLDKIDDIHIPHLPDLNPFRTAAGGSVSTSTVSSPVYLTLNVAPAPGTTTTQATDQAQAMMDAIDNRLVLVGRKPVFRR